MTAQQPAAPAPARQGSDWIDTTIEVASGATAVGMFAYGFALSYSVLHAIATAAGLPPWAADMWPLGYETFMASAALNALAEQRRRRHLPEWHQRVPWYPWTLTGLTAGASLLLNWFHPAIPLDPPPGWLKSLVYGLPPLVAVFAWHLFLQRIAHRRPAAEPEPVPVVDADRIPAGTVPPSGTATVPASAPAGDDTESRPAPVAAGDDRQAPGRPRRTAAASRPSRTGTDRAVPAELLEQAVAAARAFEAEHGRPISRDALRRALHVSNRVAGELLRTVRASTEAGRDQDRDQDRRPAAARGTAPGLVPPSAVAASSVAEAAPVPVPMPSPTAGNGRRPEPADPQPTPAPPSPSRNPARVL